jgi:hypothetical protein
LADRRGRCGSRLLSFYLNVFRHSSADSHPDTMHLDENRPSEVSVSDYFYRVSGMNPEMIQFAPKTKPSVDFPHDSGDTMFETRKGNNHDRFSLSNLL